uniref:Nuclear pore localisation protein NPL4 C-terminal domain-containing protein n=1 Tax=Lotharella globosa TaxID=91324 RepID=A0A7S4DU40_9EUKA
MEDLMLQVKDLTDVEPVDQKLMLMEPLPSRKKVDISGKDIRTTLAKVPLRKGDMLHLLESDKLRVKARPKPEKKKDETQSSSSKQKAKKGPHMTFKAYAKIAGEPVIPDFSTYLTSQTHQRSVNSYAPNIHWKLQRYRHLDMFSFPSPTALMKFYSNSRPEIKEGMSRIGIMFGRYVEDINPLVEQNTLDDLKRKKVWDYDANGVRADVQAIYEPPQEAMTTGARFLTDPRQDIVQGMADAMGLEPVGLCICKAKAPEDKKGFQTILTAKELKMLARLQGVFANEKGFSRFACVVLVHQDTIEPEAYAAADICMALERDELLGTVKGEPFKLKTETPEGADPSAMPVIYVPKDNDTSGGTNQAKIKVNPGEPFPMDFFIVKVLAAMSKAAVPLFKHCEFPVNGKPSDLKSYMQRHQNEGFASKFSDFNLLLNLPEFFGDNETEVFHDKLKFFVVVLLKPFSVDGHVRAILFDAWRCIFFHCRRL